MKNLLSILFILSLISCAQENAYMPSEETILKFNFRNITSRSQSIRIYANSSTKKVDSISHQITMGDQNTIQWQPNLCSCYGDGDYLIVIGDQSTNVGYFTNGSHSSGVPTEYWISIYPDSLNLEQF